LREKNTPSQHKDRTQGINQLFGNRQLGGETPARDLGAGDLTSLETCGGSGHICSQKAHLIGSLDKNIPEIKIAVVAQWCVDCF
jgi:hypothetical protein